ncbi:unnamed protein product [Diamesa serratosioi]
MLKHVHISPLRNRSDSISLRSTSSSSSCASSICGSPEPPNDSHTRTPSRASSYSSLNESVPQMLKHVHSSPSRNRSDSISLHSSTSSSASSSKCSSPEPTNEPQARILSKASSYLSLTESVPQTTLKVYTACMHLDIAYKTLILPWNTTSRQVISMLLRKCKMQYLDPSLFCLTMEVRMRRSSFQTIMMLDENARPAMLQACHPAGESRFELQVRTGRSVMKPLSQFVNSLDPS